MPKQLNEQVFCSWCSGKLAYTSKWASKCNSCSYRSYLNHKPCTSIIIERNNKVLMLKRALDPKKGLYDFPGGFIDITDESAEAAIYRELKEELNIQASAISKLRYIGSSSTPWEWDGTELKLLVTHFTCKLLSETSLQLDESENSELRWFAREEFNHISFAWDTDKEMLQKIWR